MKKQDIMPGDWYRILFGETPAIFLVEILLRTIIMYAVLLVTVRMMGKRTGGQLTISELAVMITLGAIVSPGMQMPQTGILLCAMILLCVLLLQRGLNLLEYKNGRFEQLSQGTLSILVRNGVMQLDEMRRTKISRQQLFTALRNKGIYNLGDVDRVYLEACGLFSVYSRAVPGPGLLLFPPGDQTIAGFDQTIIENRIVCANCGLVSDVPDHTQQCPECGAVQWGSVNITRSNQPATSIQ